MLTGAPSDIVVLDVSPQATRTYNSDEAFNPDANYGENKAVQITAATDRLQVLLTDPGERWISTAGFNDGTVYTIGVEAFTAMVAFDASDVAGSLQSLVDQINAGFAGYAASISDDSIVIESLAGAGFDVEVLEGAANVSGTVVSLAPAGERWILTLSVEDNDVNSQRRFQNYSYEHQVQVGETLAEIVSA